MSTLLIVESPGKIKKIQNFLGSNYIVKASLGHICNLPKHKMGIDINNKYNCEYDIIPEKVEIINDLKNTVKKSKNVILATDNDREGESIAWHLARILNLDINKTHRIIFNEITKDSILKALKKPTRINLNKVEAQKTRQAIDKLCGYSISPLLWKNIDKKLSAGRVQSVALRLIIDKENEINNFKTEKFFKVIGNFIDNNKNVIIGNLSINLKTYDDCISKLKLFQNSIFKVDKINKNMKKKYPTKPLITSSLQQEASNKFGFSIKQTMNIAQKLYEAGHISYHRTDSVKLSNDFLKTMDSYISEKFGKKYINIKEYKNNLKNSEEAHEAIRPTKLTIIENLTDEQEKLYNFILNRTIASQMKPSEIEEIEYIIGIYNNNKKLKEYFTIINNNILFDGFSKILKLNENYSEKNHDDDVNRINYNIIKLNNEDILEYNDITCKECYTKGGSNYTEGSLIKKLEEMGIGRPSTYSSIINKIIDRGYVNKNSNSNEDRIIKQIILKNKKIFNENKTITINNKNKLNSSCLGNLVNNYLFNNFKDLLNYELTSKIENELDNIELSNNTYYNVVNEFYNNMSGVLNKLKKNKSKKKIKIGVDKRTGKNIFTFINKYGTNIQIGDDDDNDKQFRNLSECKNTEDVTINDAINALKYPKNLGKYKNKDIILSKGRFGYYLIYNNINIPVNYNDISQFKLNNAIILIDNNYKYIGAYKNKDINLLKGKYGYYIKYDNSNFSIKNIDINNLSIKDAIKIINNKSDTTNILKKFNENSYIINGKYGIYLKHDNKNISIPDNININNISLKECLNLKQKKKFKTKKVII